MIGGFVVAALLLSPPISAQSPNISEGKSGLFASLRVGQMVEFKSDVWGIVIATYDDEEFKNVMLHRVKEIGSDYIVIEFDDKNGTGALMEYRIPVYRFSLVSHWGKMDPAKRKANSPGRADVPSDSKPDKKATPDKKPGMTKKKS
jgi:hypothetical protein